MKALSLAAQPPTQEESNIMVASFFRQLHLIKLLELENDRFRKLKADSHVKNLLYKARVNYRSTIEGLLAHCSPAVWLKIKGHLEEHYDKNQAIANIIEILYMMTPEQVNEIEDHFQSQVTIEY